MVPLILLVLRSLQAQCSEQFRRRSPAQRHRARTDKSDLSGCPARRGWCRSGYWSRVDCKRNAVSKSGNASSAAPKRTHRVSRFVRLPSEAGMVPLRLLLLSKLQTQCSAANQATNAEQPHRARTIQLDLSGCPARRGWCRSGYWSRVDCKRNTARVRRRSPAT